MHALPEQEAAQAFLAARADDEVGVRVAGGVEMPRERLRGDAVGHRSW
jgi:hypothetical protein